MINSSAKPLRSKPPHTKLPPSTLHPSTRHSLCDVLDRVLDKGAVATGEITLSLAGIDLVYLNLKLLLASSARMLAETTKNEPTRSPGPGR